MEAAAARNGEKALRDARSLLGTLRETRTGAAVIIESISISQEGRVLWILRTLDGDVETLSGDAGDLFGEDLTGEAMGDDKKSARVAQANAMVAIRWFDEHPDEKPAPATLAVLMSNTERATRERALALALRSKEPGKAGGEGDN